MYQVSTGVRSICNKDGGTLLDMVHGQVLGLNTIGSIIFERLRQGETESQIIDGLSRQFKISQEIVGADVSAFLKSLEQQGLVSAIDEETFVTGENEYKAAYSPKQDSPIFESVNGRGHGLTKTTCRELEGAPSVPSIPFSTRSDCPDANTRDGVSLWLVCIVLAGLFAFDLLGFGRNFEQMHRFVGKWRIKPRPVRGNSVDRVIRAINYACVWYPKRVRCLQRAAVTTCCLRSFGVPASMVMGAQSFPFKAHAWTEVDGQAINERRDVQRIYLIWERC